jgi:hypothetical protein
LIGYGIRPGQISAPSAIEPNTRNFARPVRVRHQWEPFGRAAVAGGVEPAVCDVSGAAAHVICNRSNSLSGIRMLLPIRIAFNFTYSTNRRYLSDLHFKVVALQDPPCATIEGVILRKNAANSCHCGDSDV